MAFCMVGMECLGCLRLPRRLSLHSGVTLPVPLPDTCCSLPGNYDSLMSLMGGLYSLEALPVDERGL